MTVARQLYVLRHAKSSWDDSSLSDHQRPLAARGRRDVALIHEYVTAHQIAPQVIWCSSALRTQQTLNAVYPDAVSSKDWLYLANAEKIIERLRKLDPEVTSVMVIGHNPSLQTLVLRLAGPAPKGSPAADSIGTIREKLPTGALVTLSLTAEWSQLGDGRMTLTDYIRPKALLQGDVRRAS